MINFFENAYQRGPQNLLSNAIKFAGDEPPEIHVGFTRNSTEKIIYFFDAALLTSIFL